jgi:hypothetical protein
VTAAGESSPSNVIVLSPGETVAPESPCALPGLTLVTSPAGLTGNGLRTGHDDLRSIAFAEPARLDEQPLENRLVITMKMATLDPQPPPGYRWITYFQVPGSPQLHWAGMSTVAGPEPAFTYGTKGELDAGTYPGAGTLLVGTFTTLGELDPASRWDPDGTIVLVLDTAALGLQRGDVITDISGSIRQSSPDATDNMGLTVDAATASGPYAVVGNASCRPNQAPLAVLAADTTSTRPRTPVTFTGAGSTDPDGDAITSYTFEFGDGVVVTQPSPTATHEYAKKGTYTVRLTVTDARGKLSTNTDTSRLTMSIVQGGKPPK